METKCGSFFFFERVTFRVSHLFLSEAEALSRRPYTLAHTHILYSTHTRARTHTHTQCTHAHSVILLSLSWFCSVALQDGERSCRFLRCVRLRRSRLLVPLIWDLCPPPPPQTPSSSQPDTRPPALLLVCLTGPTTVDCGAGRGLGWRGCEARSTFVCVTEAFHSSGIKMKFEKFGLFFSFYFLKWAQCCLV